MQIKSYRINFELAFARFFGKPEELAARGAAASSFAIPDGVNNAVMPAVCQHKLEHA